MCWAVDFVALAFLLGLFVSLKEECLPRVSSKSVLQECLPIVSHKSFFQECLQGVFPRVSSPYCLQAMFSMRVLSSVSSQDCLSKSVLHMSWQAGLGRSLLLSSLLLLVVSFFLFYVAFRFVGHCTLLATMYEKKTFSYCRGFHS